METRRYESNLCSIRMIRMGVKGVEFVKLDGDGDWILGVKNVGQVCLVNEYL